MITIIIREQVIKKGKKDGGNFLLFSILWSNLCGTGNNWSQIVQQKVPCKIIGSQCNLRGTSLVIFSISFMEIALLSSKGVYFGILCFPRKLSI